MLFLIIWHDNKHPRPRRPHLRDRSACGDHIVHLNMCSPSGALLIEKEVCLLHLLLENNRFLAPELKKCFRWNIPHLLLAIQLRMWEYWFCNANTWVSYEDLFELHWSLSASTIIWTNIGLQGEVIFYHYWVSTLKKKKKKRKKEKGKKQSAKKKKKSANLVIM